MSHVNPALLWHFKRFHKVLGNKCPTNANKWYDLSIICSTNVKSLNCRCAFALQLHWLVWFSPLHHLYLYILNFDVAVQFHVGTAHRGVLCFCFLDEENAFSPQLLLGFPVSNAGPLSHIVLFPSQASKLEKQSSMPESDYDNTFNDSELDDSG